MLCSEVMPLVEAICTIPDAFSKAASSNSDLADVLLKLPTISQFADIADAVNHGIAKHPEILQHTRISERYQRKLFKSIRIMDPLPGVIHKLLSLQSQSLTLTPGTSRLYSNLALSATRYSSALAVMVQCREAVQRVTMLPPDEFSEIANANGKLLADLLIATQSLLNACIKGTCPIPILPDSTTFFVRALGKALRCFADDEGMGQRDDSEISKYSISVLSPGLWIEPFLEGLQEIIERASSGAISWQVYVTAIWDATTTLALTSTIYRSPRDSLWSECAQCATILAQPEVQTRFGDLLLHSDSVSYASENFENDIWMSVERSRLLAVFGYGILAESLVYDAVITGSTLDWSQLAINLVGLGDNWMALGSGLDGATLVTYATPYTSNALFGIQQELEDLPLLSYFLENPIPFDDVVQILGAVERLLTIAGSATNFQGQKPIPTVYEELQLPTMRALYVAEHLSIACGSSLGDASNLDDEKTKRLLEVTFRVSETASKTLMRFAAVPTTAERFRLMMDDRSPDWRSDDNVWILILNGISAFPMEIFARCVLDEAGELSESPWLPCSFLTMIQVVAAMGPLANECIPHRAHLIMLQGQCCPNVISDCLLPSDLLGLETLAVQLRCQSEEERLLESNDQYHSNEIDLESLLEGIFIKQAEAADRKDQDRLKLRAEVLSLRRCSNLKCTTLRQSSKVALGKLCVGCKVARYCGQDCQRKDWKKGGHRLVCKLLETSNDEGAVVGE